jgi:hypothetical protein
LIHRQLSLKRFSTVFFKKLRESFQIKVSLTANLQLILKLHLIQKDPKAMLCLSNVTGFLADESLFKVPKFCIKHSGFLGFSKVQRCFLGFIIFSILYSGFFEFIFIVKHLNEVLTLAEALGTFSTAIEILVKGLVFAYNLEKVHELMGKIEAFTNEGNRGSS